ncbi:Uncharacterised protein [Chlamydia abortus]|nr:Uncharacterised protein [Chlamydia abortus]
MLIRKKRATCLVFVVNAPNIPAHFSSVSSTAWALVNLCTPHTPHNTSVISRAVIYGILTLSKFPTARTYSCMSFLIPKYAHL